MASDSGIENITLGMCETASQRKCVLCRESSIEAELISCRHRVCAMCFVEMYDREAKKVRCRQCLLEQGGDEPEQQEATLPAPAMISSPTFTPRQVEGQTPVRSQKPPESTLLSESASTASEGTSAAQLHQTRQQLITDSIDYTKLAPPRVLNGHSFGAKFNPFGVAVHPITGNIYVTDTDNHMIHVVNEDGKLISQIGGRGSGECEFNWPYSAAVTEQGFVIVTDTHNYRIQILTDTGVFVRQFGSEGTGDNQFLHPTGLACSAEHIYVADFTRIKLFTMEGQFVRGIGHPDIRQLYGIGLSSDRVIVSDRYGHVCLIFRHHTGTNTSTPWKLLRKIGELGSRPGELNEPCGLAVDSCGNILVADRGNKRVQVLSELGDVKHIIDTNDCPGAVAVSPADRIIVVRAASDLCLYGPTTQR